MHRKQPPLNRSLHRIGFSLFMTFSLMFSHQKPLRAQDFPTWLKELRVQAQQQGISHETLEKALNGISAIPKVIELDRKQPEGKITFTQYKKNVVTTQRIKQGRDLMHTHATLLEEIQKRYGVPAEYIVALWGIETSFGRNTGGFDVIAALATLAWEGRRADFFKRELLDALKILDQRHITRDSMRGSWAGAMGQNQFMPSTFLRYAVDFNKDGRKDIWGTQADVFASTAHYLSSIGWKNHQRWGRRVLLPHGFKAEGQIGAEKEQSLEKWEKLGLKTEGGKPLPVDHSMSAFLVIPDQGNRQEAYLVYNNYKTLMKWNRSTYFALSVGLLADSLKP